MPLWLQIVFCIVLTIQVPFLAWIVLQIMSLRANLAAIRERVAAREIECGDRLVWLRGVDIKIDKLTANVSEILGYLKAKETSL